METILPSSLSCTYLWNLIPPQSYSPWPEYYFAYNKRYPACAGYLEGYRVYTIVQARFHSAHLRLYMMLRRAQSGLFHRRHWMPADKREKMEQTLRAVHFTRQPLVLTNAPAPPRGLHCSCSALTAGPFSGARFVN
jgi:hypothetical protein